jgi:predicted MarR family transcription regulator
MIDQSGSRTTKPLAKTESRRAARVRSAAPELLVSSAHLVSEKSGELSEFEFGLIIAGHASSIVGWCAAWLQPASRI